MKVTYNGEEHSDSQVLNISASKEDALSSLQEQDSLKEAAIIAASVVGGIFALSAIAIIYLHIKKHYY